jgi:hypothetical protein
MVFLLLSSPSTIAISQQEVSYQVGAVGDYASLGSLGVEAEIQTNAYKFPVGVSVEERSDYFYVGSDLANGGFIQFGYALNPGQLCLAGFQKSGKVTCTGTVDSVGNGDARWEWQYWPSVNGTDFYAGTGFRNSAGANGIWHKYSLLPAANSSGWVFAFDGAPVGEIDFAPSVSSSSVFIYAEQLTSLKLASLGPVEFRNISYLTNGGWKPVVALYASIGCGALETCTQPNPYGVEGLGSGVVIVGSNIPIAEDGQMIWSGNGYHAPEIESTIITFVLIAIPAALGILYVIDRIDRRRRAVGAA